MKQKCPYNGQHPTCNEKCTDHLRDLTKEISKCCGAPYELVTGEFNQEPVCSKCGKSFIAQPVQEKIIAHCKECNAQFTQFLSDGNCPECEGRICIGDSKVEKEEWEKEFDEAFKGEWQQGVFNFFDVKSFISSLLSTTEKEARELKICSQCPKSNKSGMEFGRLAERMRIKQMIEEKIEKVKLNSSGEERTYKLLTLFGVLSNLTTNE